MSCAGLHPSTLKSEAEAQEQEQANMEHSPISSVPLNVTSLHNQSPQGSLLTPHIYSAFLEP